MIIKYSGMIKIDLKIILQPLYRIALIVNVNPKKIIIKINCRDTENENL
jgi:hypothetical protein